MNLSEETPAIIMTVDRGGAVTFMNRFGLDFFGYAVEELIGRDMSGMITPDTGMPGATLADALREAQGRFDQCVQGEYEHLRQSGERAWVLWRTTPVASGPGGVSAGHICIGIDITEHHHLEVVLRTSEDYYKAFIESSEDCIVHITLEGRILTMNRAGCILNEVDDPVIVTGKNFSATTHENRTAVREAITSAAAGATISVRHKTVGRRGSQTWWDSKFTPVTDLDGSIKSILVVSRDITEQKLIEQALEDKNRELGQAYNNLQAAQSQILQQEKMASIGQLAAGVAHEINNPMGFIISNLGSLRKYLQRISEFLAVQAAAIEETTGGVSAAAPSLQAVVARVEAAHRSLKIDYIMNDVTDILDESLEGAERVKRIVQDLKRFSHVDEAETKTTDINAELESTINIAWNEIKYKASLIKDFGGLPMIQCNPGQLNQVFMNLLVNASQAIERQGEIRVKTWHESGTVRIAISDTGSGIPPDKLGRIFEPFFTTKEVGKGTGLGLSIAYDIIKKHSGTIEVHSTVGEGTTFTVSIPVAE